MSYLYIHPDFPLLEGGPTGPARIGYPFWGESDTTTITIEQDWIQSSATYRPLALNAPIDISAVNIVGFTVPEQLSSCIYLDDSPPASIGFGAVQVTRTWGTVPISRPVPASFSASYPGYATLDPSISILSEEVLTFPSGTSITFYAQNINTGPEVGSTVYGVFMAAFRRRVTGTTAVLYDYTYRGDYICKSRTASVAVASPFSVSGDNGYTPTIYDFPGHDGWQLYDLRHRGWSDLPMPGRAAFTRLITGRKSVTYAVGLSAAVLAATPKLEATDSTGAITTTLTTTTSPSTYEWRRNMNAGVFFAAEDSSIERYRGDIYAVTTPMAPYR